MKFIAYYDSPLGKITLAGDEAGLCGLWFEGEKYYAHALAASGADEKQGSADLLAKERRAASETQRNFAASKKSKKSDFAAKSGEQRRRQILRAYTYSERKILRKRAKRLLRGEKPGRFRSNEALARSIF